MDSRHRIYNDAYTFHLHRIYDTLNTTGLSDLDVQKQFVKVALEDENFLGQEVPLVINHFMMRLTTAYRNKTGKELEQKEVHDYANTLGLGPFIATA